jgi:cell division septum initiation protein DivIVA
MPKAQYNSSLIAERRQLEEQRDALERRINKLKSSTEAILEMSEEIRVMAKERNVPLLEIAYALVPDLAKDTGSHAEVSTSKRTRPLKRYNNPHNGETIETKGGNHTKLKEWKSKWGAAEVETWLQK